MFFAGIVRGCLGFGFSALVVASASLFINPLLAVPLVVLLEIVASIQLLFSVWRDALWKLLTFMTIGTIIGIPIGLVVLSVSPQATLKIIVSCFIFLMTSILLGGVTYKGTLTKSILTLTGIVAGLFNGVTASGGLVAATFLPLRLFPSKILEQQWLFSF